ncbi:nucleotidyltransferase domain-containing protein [Deinococcus roseus]|uniref:Polymerase nucleotidyl transferase domain-containing protein n=1 Tax=Deinococcus roseus TaxID=392414 RepID=A0ABQ2D1C5_9DEIO|nr:nucleotidyltransferase domain-containing protein [Deinococcus roseus]GGJ41234.1 hypothetical protein GCM10008938_29080 [Deinococcus roseus]
MNSPEDLLQELTAQLVQEGAEAVLLLGSMARGEEVLYSDLDLHAVYQTVPTYQQRIFYQNGQLVTISFYTWDRKELAFTDAQTALWNIEGMRHTRILHDPEGRFADLQKRALAFEWREVQDAALVRISSHLYNTIEESHKVMGALTTHNPEKCLFALQGMQWPLAEASAFANGALIVTENRYWSTIRDREQDPVWRENFWTMLGFTDASILERGVAGLRLYLRTFELYGQHVKPEQRQTVQQAVQTIRAFLEQRGY